MGSLKIYKEKIFNRTRALTLGLIAAAMFSGCAVKKPFWQSKDLGGINLQTAVRTSTSLAHHDINLGEASRVPVHSDDGDPSRIQGANPSSFHGFSCPLKWGYELSVGNDNVRLYGGINAITEVLSHVNNGYRQGIYDVALQNAGGKSYAYAQVTPSLFSYEPVVGIEALLMNKILINAEMGIHCRDFELEKGHDRWGKWEPYGKDKWRGNTRTIGLGLEYVFEKNPLFSIGLNVKHEANDIKFFGEKGEINTTLFSIMLRSDM